jgi:hypothetical protein
MVVCLIFTPLYCPRHPSIDLHRGHLDEKYRIYNLLVPIVLSPECIGWTIIGGGMACAPLASAKVDDIQEKEFSHRVASS